METGSGGARGVTRGGSGDRGEGRGGGRVTTLGGERRKERVPRSAALEALRPVAAARTRTARTPRGASVPARAGARRRWGTGVTRAPDNDANIIADILTRVSLVSTRTVRLRGVGPLRALYPHLGAGEGRVLTPRADDG